MAWASTGYECLDQILCDLRKGDNVVWQVDSIEDYNHFVTPYVEKALQDGRELVYIRFAEHPPLIKDETDIKKYDLNANKGFEAFSKQIHEIISRHGLDTYYVFDCLSDLLSAWATDLMIGNFFKVTCPYLFELDTIAYFAILRNYHSFETVARIRETTQLLLDVYDFDDNFYVHPLKVWNRYSPTMFLPHLQKGKEFLPVTSSVDTSRLLSHISDKGLKESARTLDYWDRLFMKAEELRKSSPETAEEEKIVSELCRIMVGKEQRFSELAKEHFSLHDLVNIKERLIGSGFIGGKAAGMLLAQKILLNDPKFNWEDYLEPHDSFYLGSDVFYSYIVENGWWKLLMQQKTKEGFFKFAPKMKENLLNGKFPNQVRDRFQELIEYFGQSPIIIRSSSLLEDSFGNAFAGKYESYFLVNQGDPEVRYKKFEEAVRKIYASTMNEDALAYRLQRGLDQQDEQMAILVQRVSGSYKKTYFFPDMAGVGVSYNTFVWHPDLDPEAGLIRLVFGLGTRAVNRVEDDYPQIVALDKPLLRPYADRQDVNKYSQHKVDLLNITENKFENLDSIDLLNDDINVPKEMIADLDRETMRKMKDLNIKDKKPWVLTFQRLLSETDFVSKMQKMLKTIEKHYKYPVDVEFTVNFDMKQNFRFNLVQCRPLQTKGLKAGKKLPENIGNENTLFSSEGYMMGGNIAQPVKRVIYVDPGEYVRLPIKKQYRVARIIGKLNKQIETREKLPTILMGPGRWGTTTPSLGVPVHFSEISKVLSIVEIAYEEKDSNLMPELSFGSHFFQDLVETEIFYVALIPERKEVTFNRDIFSEQKNILPDILPEEKDFRDIIKVIESDNLQLISDILTQKVICFYT